jgi:hypothetical protein
MQSTFWQEQAHQFLTDMQAVYVCMHVKKTHKLSTALRQANNLNLIRDSHVAVLVSHPLPPRVCRVEQVESAMPEAWLAVCAPCRLCRHHR